MRLAIFDCDGTLVDSQTNICRAATTAFALSGLARPPEAAIRRIVGLSLVEAMQVLAPHAGDAVHRRLADDYKAAFQDMRAAKSLDPEPLFDGIIDALDGLAADGWQFGIATGKSDRGLALLLAQHGVADRFVTLQTADRHPSKPHPSMLRAALAQVDADPHKAVMIGDTGFDMAMARGAGVSAVGVAWGYHAAAELTVAGAHVVADDARDLPHLLRELVPA